MAGIDFDRQVFVAPEETEPAPKPPSRILGVVILTVAVVGIGFVGYKLMSDPSLSAASAESNNFQQIQQQLADIKERLDQQEKRRKLAVPDSTVAPLKVSPTASGPATRSKSAYQISAASALSPQRSASSPVQPPVSRPTAAVVTTADDTAARESWQATTDRLADVVGAVGSQEGEISQTRDQLNQLLSQTRRTALQFELARGTGRQSVGPVELVLKSSDSKNQRYSVCVYVNTKCVELKDRVLDEVVVFVLTRGTPPFELVATRITRDEIVGYLEVPTEQLTH